MSGEFSSPGEKPVDPVVLATDRRIRERGLADFKETIEHMAVDPNWAPDPLDIIEAGIPAEGEVGDFTLPDDLV